jgi:hypothetical protein
MELSSSWEAANCAAFVKPEVFQCSQEPSTGPILRQINPIITIPSYIPKIYFNTIIRVYWVKGHLLNTLERLYIYELSKKKLQMNNSYTDTHNPIFDLIINNPY